MKMHASFFSTIIIALGIFFLTGCGSNTQTTESIRDMSTNQLISGTDYWKQETISALKEGD